jgi:hypothetical protein
MGSQFQGHVVHITSLLVVDLHSKQNELLVSNKQAQFERSEKTKEQLTHLKAAHENV